MGSSPAKNGERKRLAQRSITTAFRTPVAQKTTIIGTVAGEFGSTWKGTWIITDLKC